MQVRGFDGSRRHRRRSPAAVLLVVLLSVAWNYYRNHRPLPAGEGLVVGVTDGDTLKVLVGGKETRVRLHGIDAPERHQAFGTQAKKFVSALAMRKRVQVRIVDTDRYGRTVADIILPDGSNLNYEIVRAGYAWWYQRYSDDPELGRLEDEARAAKRGLWADPHPIPPWEYRRGAR